MYKILVVDDDDIDRIHFRRTLLKNDKNQYEILDASSGKEAMQIARHDKPHCLLLDYHLPDCNGIEFIQSFRENPDMADVPIIILTGQSSEEIVLNALKAGAEDYLPKDQITKKNLNHTVSKCIKIFDEKHKTKEQNKEIQYIASHDCLTGLTNRRQFEVETKKLLSSSKRHHRKFAIMYIDLDKFKYANDTYGHEVGDKLLIEVSSRLKQLHRTEDVIARLGGDEFAVLLSDAKHINFLSQKAEQIIQSLSEPYYIDGYELDVNASIGIVWVPEYQEDYKALLRSADRAMYKAKSQGSGQYVLYTDQLSTEYQQRLKLENDLSHAIKNNELTLKFQPIIDIQKQQLLGVEALIRWNHPELGAISSIDMIKAAEEANLIHTIGHWVIMTACQKIREWQFTYQHKILLSLNISAIQLYDEHFFDKLCKNIHQYELCPDQVMIEIKESTFKDNNPKTITCLELMKQNGFKICIDDFGMGDSSLARLSNLPITTLKIDRNFVHGIETQSNNIAIIKSIIDIAKNFELDVIAEGIETPAQCDIITQHGCHVAQGFLFSEPRALSDITPKNWSK